MLKVAAAVNAKRRRAAPIGAARLLLLAGCSISALYARECSG
jgi:hypothetical protein